jgi:hypothetical protein
MRVFTKFVFDAAIAVAIAGGLQACGGGGGGDAPATPPPAAAVPAPPATTVAAIPTPPAAQVPATVTISGKQTYESIPNKAPSGAATGGALLYAAPVIKPIRGVTVQAVAVDGKVLATTTTDDVGAYSLVIPSNTMYVMRLRAELIKTTGPATWSVALKDNTQGDALHVLETPVVSSGIADNPNLNIKASSGWGGTSYTSVRAGGLAAVLDTIYSGMKVVVAAQPTIAFPPLVVFWSSLNGPVRGNIALGEIGTSYFTTSTTGARSIYLLGKENVDTDEYDSSVVAHEYGHYLQSAFSTNHSLGGAHSFRDKLDMTVAFSEGWGNAWSGIARNDPVYTDSFGLSQASGFGFSLAVAATDVDRGWYREDSIDASLYALHTQHGFGPIWTALTGPMKTSQNALASIFSFADAVRAAATPSVVASLNSLLTDQKIVITGADQWGSNETNNGGIAENLPVYTTLTLGGTATRVCFTNANMGSSTSINKLGAVKYFRVTLPVAGPRTITATFQAGRNIDFDLFQNRTYLGGKYTQSTPGTPTATTEIGTNSFSAGELIIVAYDFVTTTPPVSPNCATLRIQ